MDTGLFYNLETELLKPEVRSSAEKLNELIADDFIEFGASGKTYSKNEILERLPKETRQEKFTVSNFEAKELQPGVVATTYELEKEADGKVSRSLRNSIWMQSGDKWQIAFHKGTFAE